MELVEKNIKALETLRTMSRKAKVGEFVICPTCGHKFVKSNKRQVYCFGNNLCCEVYHSHLLPNRNGILNNQIEHLDNVVIPGKTLTELKQESIRLEKIVNGYKKQLIVASELLKSSLEQQIAILSTK